MGNRFGDSPDDVIPTVAVNVVSEVIDTDDPTITDGTITLEAVRSADLTNGTIEVEDVSWMVESPTHLIVTVNMADEDQTPRVVLLSEPAEPSVYPSDDNPTNYSPGVYVDGVLVGLTRSLDDATVWRGEIFLEDPATCTHYALWVSGLDGISGPAQWIDLGTVHMREFVVTTALGTNGTVDVPAYNGLELEVMVPSAAWPNDPTCLLVSPTVPPFLSVDQERYLEPVDSTAYHLELLTGTGEFVRGREPLVNIYYDEANALARALMNVADEDVDESDLTVRRWDFGSSNVDGTTGAWTGAGISHIKVYPDENRVSFRVRDLTGGGSSGSEERVTIDMALALDGSGSIDAADFTLQLQGVAAALQDQTIIPRDGSFSIAVVQFGAASGDAVVEIPLTTVTSDAVAQTLATQVLAIVQGDGGTPMAEGIEVSVDALATGTGTVQVIVLATDGAPNDGAAALAAADAAVAAGIDEIHAIGVGAGADLVFLGQLVRNGTVDVAVDYEEFAQVIGSKLRSIISGAQGGQGRVFQLFLPKRNAPVVVSSIWPDSPYVTDWRTDADPVIVAYLRDPGGQAINPAEVQLLIDNEEWATWMDGEGDAEFIRGNGEATLTYVNQEQTVMELVYHHSTYPRDWLRDSTDPQAADSVHTLTIRYRASGGTDDWQEWMEPFRVDRKSPYIEFDGGFVGNPRLNNVAGYMNPAGDRLIARMYDGGMGILFKHDRPWYFQDLDCDGLLNLDERQFDPWPYPELEDYFGCWVRSDWGVKYDVWRIDPSCPEPCHEDDQSDIDEIEERHLLYTGTAGAIEPYLMVDGERITLDEYDPADTLEVPVVNLGGGSIKDGDVLEITWYSEKWIEANSDGPGFGCPIDTMWVGGDQILVWSAGCSWDSQSQEMHLYQEGIQDWASNSGSQYAEQRFIVDSSGPNCAIVSPQATVEPNGDLVIDVTFDDTGVGIDGESIEVTVIDPEGNVHTPDDINPVDGRFQAVIEGPLMRGEWQVRVTAEDALDNACNSVRTVRVEAAVLTMAGAYVSPNPFNPNDLSNGMATIFLNLSRASFVTAKVYDFAGLEVATLANNEWMTPGQNLQWSGQARGQGNTDLANGAYIIRVTADDGVRTVESNLKVVIWRE